MNSLAQEINEILINNAPVVYHLLSHYGEQIFFPKGIISQSQEAKIKAHKFNATIGIATEHGDPVYLPVIQRYIHDIEPKNIYPYAPTAGKPELRKAWYTKMLSENPTIRNKKITLPIVLSGITHGLSIVGDLFLNGGDELILPDLYWGNYNLIYKVRHQANITSYPLFNSKGGFNLKGFEEHLNQRGEQNKKLSLLFNFPHNPTGYTLTEAEANAIRDILYRQADKGHQLLVITDDSYFSLFFGESMKESLFGYITGIHKNILAIKLDGATKEEYAWGLRTGFITFGLAEEPGVDDAYAVLEKKVMGSIRNSISNASHLSQTLILKALESPTFTQEKNERFEILKSRVLKVKEVMSNPKFLSVWDYYPFNSGYFMCIKLKTVDAEKLRKHILNQYGVGVISIDRQNIRIAFSCVEENNISELFDLIYKGIKDLE